MADRLKGKKALITGGAQGLGATIGRMMAAEGALVTLTDRNEAGARETAAALNAEHGREIGTLLKNADAMQRIRE